jgi:hypothetical protein
MRERVSRPILLPSNLAIIAAVIAVSVGGIVKLTGGPFMAERGASVVHGTAAFGDWRTDRPETRQPIGPQSAAPDMA